MKFTKIKSFFIYLLLFSANFLSKPCLSIKSIYLSKFEKFSYNLEPRFSFNLEFKVPLLFFDNSKISAEIQIPVTLTIKEDQLEASDEFDQNAVSMDDQNSQSTESSYPAYIPIYYDDIDYDKQQQHQQQQNQFQFEQEKESNETIGFDRRRLIYSLRRIKRDENSDNTSLSTMNLLSNSMKKYWLDGKECFFKLICQVSRMKIADYNFIQTFLVTTYKLLADHNKMLFGPFREAQQFGRISGNCEQKYSKCS